MTMAVSASTATQPTRIAVLGTLAEFHREPIPYDLRALVRLVGELHPDLLCLDMTPEQWARRDFGGLPPEYREALLPLAHQTDIVIVPIAGDNPPPEPAAPGGRGRVIVLLRRLLAYLQRTAPNPKAVVEGSRHHIADFLYEASAWLAGPETYRAWKAHTDELGRQVLAIARRDPSTRVLVAVNLRHCHHIRRALRQYPDVRVVSSADL